MSEPTRCNYPEHRKAMAEVEQLREALRIAANDPYAMLATRRAARAALGDTEHE